MRSFSLIAPGKITVAIIILTFFSFLSCDISPEQVTREYGWFEFVIPDYDTTHNVVDMSFLNEK